MTILDAMRDETLFSRWFQGESWRTWIVFLSALFGLPLTDEQAELFRKHTGRAVLPVAAAREAWLVVGRRGGKSLVAALVALWRACFQDYSRFLAPGEVATVMIIAADRRQARVVMRYLNGFIDTVPMLAAMVTRRTREAVEFNNRVVVEIHVCSFRSTRGYALAAVVADEIAFWRTEDSANPDTEVINSLRPGMATIPGSLLLCISSPYARRGALWETYQRHFGKDGDPVLVWQADTRSMNPSVDQAVIDQAYEEDEASASAEYGALFRRDIETYISREAVDACVIPGRHELPPTSDCQYHAFVDPSGGSVDSFTLAIAHQAGDHYQAPQQQINKITFGLQDELAGDRAPGVTPLKWREIQRLERRRSPGMRKRDSEGGQLVLDLVREVKPPFSPEAVVKEFCDVLRTYRVSEVTGDRYGGEWPREQFRKGGVTYRTSDESKSEIYQATLPLLNSARVELLDHPRLKSQLLGLERKVSRAGKDSIDHGPGGGHDDLINAAAGAITAAQRPRVTGGVRKIVGFN